MPYSDPANKPWTIQRILAMQPETVLDVGCGAGVYGSLLRDVVPVVDGIEVWEPYIDRFSLRQKYTNLFVTDVREHQEFNYDVVIFGDVIEHMTEADAVIVWEAAKAQAKWLVISIPIIHWPQGEEEGNPYERHVEDHYSVERVLRVFDGIVEHVEFEMTGVFVARGDA